MQRTAAFPAFFRRPFSALRGVLALAAAAAGLLVSGCNTTTSEPSDLMLFAENAPLPQIVAQGTELAAAERAAKAQRGCFAVQGEGFSMEPMYVSGTAVVVRVGGYDNLRSGQPVVYRTRSGMTVAHMLVRPTDYGWVAAGLNNNGRDVELVTADNLVGVITQAYASRTGSLPKAVAARMALNEQIRSGSKIASMGL